MDPQRTQLLIVDFQEKLFPAMPSDTRDAALKAADNLLYLFEALDLPTLRTEQYPQGLGPTLPALARGPSVSKLHFSALGEPGVASLLTRPVQVVLGMEAHICVAHTVQGLLASGHEVIVAADACLSRRPADRQLGLDWARQLGAWVLPSETILFGLLQQAGGPRSSVFKEVSRRIR